MELKVLESYLVTKSLYFYARVRSVLLQQREHVFALSPVLKPELHFSYISGSIQGFHCVKSNYSMVAQYFMSQMLLYLDNQRKNLSYFWYCYYAIYIYIYIHIHTYIYYIHTYITYIHILYILYIYYVYIYYIYIYIYIYTRINNQLSSSQCLFY